MSGVIVDLDAVSPPASKIFSLFGDDAENDTQGAYSLLGALTLSGPYMTDWFAIASSIFLWMAVSYCVLYLGASLVALLMMRRHPYVVLFVIPLLAMCVIGPATVGVLTSMVLAYTLTASDKEISPWHCMVLGVFQSIMMIVVSFSRLLGTLYVSELSKVYYSLRSKALSRSFYLGVILRDAEAFFYYRYTPLRSTVIFIILGYYCTV